MNIAEIIGLRISVDQEKRKRQDRKYQDNKSKQAKKLAKALLYKLENGKLKTISDGDA